MSGVVPRHPDDIGDAEEGRLEVLGEGARKIRDSRLQVPAYLTKDSERRAVEGSLNACSFGRVGGNDRLRQQDEEVLGRRAKHDRARVGQVSPKRGRCLAEVAALDVVEGPVALQLAQVAVGVVDIGSAGRHVLLAPLRKAEERPVGIACVGPLDKDPLVDQLPDNLAEPTLFDLSERRRVALHPVGRRWQPAPRKYGGHVQGEGHILLRRLAAQRFENRLAQ